MIQELKSNPNREKRERRLLKNDVLWKESKFVIIDNKKRILVPFLSVDKENVVGFLTLYRDAENKIQYDMTVRRDVYTKNAKLPFWTPNIWAGYFMAYDRTLLGKKNGNPGFKQTIANNKKSKANTNATARTVCDLYETITTHCSYAYWESYSGEGYGFVDNGCTDSYSYSYECYWVPDPVEPVADPVTDPSDGGGGDGAPITVNSPDIPITNINDYLKCININQGAIITIYADQPYPNTSYTSYLGDVGHAFISIEQNGILKSYGFYPASGGLASANPLFVPVYGTMGDDSSHTYDVSISTYVDSGTLNNIINFSMINQHATYDLNDNNCTDFAIGIAGLIGLNVSDCYGSFAQGIAGGGSNPGTFGEELRNITLPLGFTRKNDTNNSPNNIGTCNK